MRLSDLMFHRMSRAFVGKGNGVSRGDRNRNARLARLRTLVTAGNAIVGIDLADSKQMVVVTDHDLKVLARKVFRCRAWDLGTALDWAHDRALETGFAGVRAKLIDAGRPGLRPAAWRAVWGALRINPVYTARYQHLTGREDNKLTPTQAQAAVAATILRHLHAVVTTGKRWDPHIATHGNSPATTTPAAA